MFPLTEKDILTALGETAEGVSNAGVRVFSRLSTDSRSVPEGAVFLPIRGDRFDGHDFIGQSVESGASAVISEKNPDAALSAVLGDRKVLFIKVKSTLDALWRIAGFNRRKSRARVIGITGSNGKTTTKEFLYKILRSRHETIASDASFNNHIGVPLTLLKISPETRYAVIEMGMNHKDELKNLTRMAMPDVTVVTNVAESHMEFFKNKREVAAAKAEIFLGLQENGYAVLNRDSAYFSVLRQRAHKRTLTFGSHPHATYRISEITQKGSGYSFLFGKKGKVSRYLLSIPGFHNIYNAAASVSVCLEEGIPAEAVKKELTKVKLPKMRMELRRTSGGVTIINDAYNANPFSTENAIRTLSGMETGGRRVMVFADMLELGKRAEMYHRKIGRLAARGNIDYLLCIGDDARFTCESFNENAEDGREAFFFSEKKKIAGKLNEIMKKGDIVLFKGSRGMKLEEIVNGIK